MSVEYTHNSHILLCVYIVHDVAETNFLTTVNRLFYTQLSERRAHLKFLIPFISRYKIII